MNRLPHICTMAPSRRFNRRHSQLRRSIQALGPLQVTGVFVLAALLCGSSPAGAQTAPAVGAEEAKGAHASSNVDELYQKGIELYSGEKWQEAEVVFEALWAQSRTYDIAAKLGHTEFRLKKPREAAEHFTFAMRNWPLAVKTELLELVKQRLEEARRQVGSLSIRTSVAGAVIRIDGTKAGESPLPSEVFVTPGRYTIKAELAEYEPASSVVEVPMGGSREVALTLHRKPAADKGKSTALIVAGAAMSLAAVGVGAGFMLAAGDRRAEADKHSAIVDKWACNSSFEPRHSNCDLVKDARDAQFRLENIATGVFVGGGAIGVATLAYALWPSAKPKSQTGVQVQPVITDSDGGLWVSGRF